MTQFSLTLGLLVVSLVLAISTVVLFSLRGLGPLTVAFG